jgi:hypothetical protein
VRVESSPDNAGTGRYCQTARVRQARREGATRVNQCQSSVSGVPALTWWIWAGEQRTPAFLRATPKPDEGAGQEATAKVCGVAVAMLPGQQLGTSLDDRLLGERGNHPRSPSRPADPAGRGQARRRLMAVGWDGGFVVVRARESRAHGEGSQQTRSEDAGMPGGRR